MVIDLDKLCDEAREFWNYGPWLVSDLTEENKDMYVVPFHLESDPSVTALAAPDLVHAALNMDLSAINILDKHLKSQAE
jgi:hypothetical protein